MEPRTFAASTISRIQTLTSLVLCTAFITGLLMVPFVEITLWNTSAPKIVGLIAPFTPILVGLLVLWGLRQKMRGAWTLAMLTYGPLFLGAAAYSVSWFPDSPGLALIALFAGGIAWGLPTLLLFMVRREFFIDEPQG